MPESKLNESALPRKDFDRELPAIFSRHGSFERLHQRRRHASIICELLAAIVNADTCSLQNIFVICAFVGVLEPSPAAHVVNQEVREACAPLLNILQKLTKPIPAREVEPASPVVIVCSDDVHIVSDGIFRDGVRLVLWRILLMFR